MPTPGAGINGIAVLYDTNANDKTNSPSFGTTLLTGFAIDFELSANDRRYFETTTIAGFGIEFEYSSLYSEEIYLHQ